MNIMHSKKIVLLAALFIFGLSTSAFADTFTIKASASPKKGGTISPSGKVTVGPGASRQFTITPNAGYEIKDVIVDRVSQGAIDTYTFTDITQNHSITTKFVKKTFTVTIEESGEVHVSPVGTIKVASGKKIKLKIKANSEGAVPTLLVDGQRVKVKKSGTGYQYVLTVIGDTLVNATSGGDSPPMVSNVILSYPKLPVLYAHEKVKQSITYEYSNPYMDKKNVTLTLSGPSGLINTSSESLNSKQPTGVGSRTFVIDSSYVAGSYTIGIEIVDAFGNSSGIRNVSFTVGATTPKLLEITGNDPSSGVPGDQVIITGIGFETEPTANIVSFAKAHGSAVVLSASSNHLEVIVPEGASTGTIGLTTSKGRTDSPAPFNIIPTVFLSPASTRLLTGASTDFLCVLSGTESSSTTWTINGQGSPGPSLGTIDSRGHFTAPASLPAVNPLRLRCASADLPTVFAEANIEVVTPALMLGQDLVRATTGGEVKSDRGEVAVTIPPAAMASDTPISVQKVGPDQLPTPTEGSFNLAAAQLEPKGLRFSQPVTVIFSLISWEEPGTVLFVYLFDETSKTLSSTSRTAVVDETGFKAVAAIDHFSTYVLTRTLTPAEREVIQSTTEGFQIGRFEMNSFDMSKPHELTYLEGLSVPVLIKYSGAVLEVGPLLGKSLTVRGIIPATNTPLKIGPILQPNADGRELGTVINIPTLPTCGEGKTASANLIIGWEKQGIAETATIPFTIQCLDEMNFAARTPPKSLPSESGSYFTQNADGTIDVYLYTGLNYRFSEMKIGQGGRLNIMYYEPQIEPALIEVTGDVVVNGEIISTGGKGGQGADGTDSWTICWQEDIPPTWVQCHETVGGKPGTGGFPFGGDGGRGANYTGTRCSEGPSIIDKPGCQFACAEDEIAVCPWWDKDSCDEVLCKCFPNCTLDEWNNGEPGQDSATLPSGGGKGGWPGDFWDAGSMMSFMKNIRDIIYDILGGPTGWIEIIVDGAEAYEEGLKIWNDSFNQLRSAGHGGYGASHGYAADLSYFSYPLSGGGGGGAGKMAIELDADRAGGGGGGGGGGAPSLKIVTSGIVFIGRNGAINGKGGNGGSGGEGDGDWGNQAAGGGGGGGGNGAQIHIVARELMNNGTINLKKGLGGASGYFLGTSLCEYNQYTERCMLTSSEPKECPPIDDGSINDGFKLTCPENYHCHFSAEFGPVTEVGCAPDPSPQWFVGHGFGSPGINGVLRVDGPVNPSSNQPLNTNFYRGPYLGPMVQVTGKSQFCEQIFLGDLGSIGYQDESGVWYNNPTWCFNDLQPGLNSLSVTIDSPYLQGYEEITLHPWQNQYVFYFPGTSPSPPSCTFSVNPASASYSAPGGSGSVTVTASSSACVWTAKSNASWITVTGSSSGSGSGTVSYSVAAHWGMERSGTITIAGKTFKVTQAAASSCTYSISPASASYTATGGSGKVTVTASSSACAWTAKSNASWITITGGSSGTGNGTVSYSVTANTSPTLVRNGTITIAGKTFTVSQTGPSCTYSISPTSASFSADSGSGKVTVTASSIVCKWTAKSNASWITITGGSSGTGSGTVSYSVAAGAARIGTMTIAGKTFTVNQAPAQ